MRTHPASLVLALAVVASSLGLACSDDDPTPTEAEQLELGAHCMNDAQCDLRAEGVDSEFRPICLDGFEGGSCGLLRCGMHDECPEGSACIGHDDGFNYCFALCDETADCNRHRADDVAAVCMEGMRSIGPDLGTVCVPPMSGL